MPPVSTVYVAFFLAAVFILFLVFCVKTPELWRSWRRFCRQMLARKTREERMLADLEKLMAEARRLEGLYCFERIEAHPSPVLRAEKGEVIFSGSRTMDRAAAASTEPMMLAR